MKTLSFMFCLVVLTATVGFAQVKPDDTPSSTLHPFDKSQRTLSPEVMERIQASHVPADMATDNARSLFSQKRYREAEAECQRAIALSPKVGGFGRDGVALNMMPFNSSTLILLGEIYLAQGRNKEALTPLLICYKITGDTVLDLDVALAYCRLGKYDEARKFYSDDVVLRYVSITAEDLPGTRTARTLEASILFARGMEVYLTSRPKEALDDFAAASKLVPNNGVFAFFVGRTLQDIKRHSEALSYYRTAIRCLRFKSTFMESAKEREQNMIYYKKIGL